MHLRPLDVDVAPGDITSRSQRRARGPRFQIQHLAHTVRHSRRVQVAVGGERLSIESPEARQLHQSHGCRHCQPQFGAAMAAPMRIIVKAYWVT